MYSPHHKIVEHHLLSDRIATARMQRDDPCDSGLWRCCDQRTGDLTHAFNRGCLRACPYPWTQTSTRPMLLVQKTGNSNLSRGGLLYLQLARVRACLGFAASADALTYRNVTPGSLKSSETETIKASSTSDDCR
jgi:hypothetical protein